MIGNLSCKSHIHMVQMNGMVHLWTVLSDLTDYLLAGGRLLGGFLPPNGPHPLAESNNLKELLVTAIFLEFLVMFSNLLEPPAKTSRYQICIDFFLLAAASMQYRDVLFCSYSKTDQSSAHAQLYELRVA